MNFDVIPQQNVIDNCYVPYVPYNPQLQQFNCGVYYTFYVDKTEKAINVVKGLIANKHIKEPTLEKFLQLVDEIKTQL